MSKDSLHFNSGNRSHPVLAVSMGDMNGIGPEVALKAISKSPAGVLFFASQKVIRFYSDQIGIPPFQEFHSGNIAGHDIAGREEAGKDDPNDTGKPGKHKKRKADFWDKANFGIQTLSGYQGDSGSLPEVKAGQVVLVPMSDPQEPVRPGTVSAEAGSLAMKAVSAGVAACLAGKADALVTAPISKEAIHMAGYHVPGHTEYLAELTGTDDFGMILVSKNMRIGLATIHIPVREIPQSLTRSRIETRLRLFHHTLRTDFGISRPRIAVLGLNPHAGDGGVLGTEEKTIIRPAIENIRSSGINADGPWPADGFFARKEHENYDLVLAMYHDQGLIPLKLSGFGSGVNITAGLPIIRTSPDHGTAFGIAGSNTADPSSMESALELARLMAGKRSRA